MLLNCKFVKKDLVESFIELIQQLELVIFLFLHPLNAFNSYLWEGAVLVSRVRVTLVERKHFLFLGLKLAAEFSCLEDLLSEMLILC